MKHIIIGSRGSDLALWQANHVRKQLENLGSTVEIKIIKTQGDLIQHLSFDKMEGKGFFTKELETELLSGNIDLAVHSHKDLETVQPEGLMVAAVSEREAPNDILVVRKEAVEDIKWNVKTGATVGTSSARRKSQLLANRPDFNVIDLRGNVPTRIQKLRDGLYDAILLAKAGTDRLEINLDEFHVEVLPVNEFVPAPAQGVLGLQIRSNDKDMANVMAQLNHPDVKEQIDIERGVLNKMEGGCQLPLGVFVAESEILVAFAEESSQASEYLTFERNTSVETIVSHLKSKIG